MLKDKYTAKAFEKTVREGYRLHFPNTTDNIVGSVCDLPVDPADLARHDTKTGKDNSDQEEQEDGEERRARRIQTERVVLIEYWRSE